MPHHLSLLDLALVVLVVLAVLSALRGGRGLLSALASGATTALVAWLLAGAVLALAPHEVREPVARSGFAATFDPPAWAFDRLARAV